MSHIQYTIQRSGTYYYNRRVPKHAVETYGRFIRQALSKDRDEAEAYAKRLSNVLEGSWCGQSSVKPVDVASVVESFKPKSVLLSEMAEEYLSLRKIDQTPPRVALKTFLSLAGDRDVSEYTREDTKLFVRHLAMKGNKTTTMRRRVNSLSAILNYAYSELDLEKRNPFSRLIIKGEGEDKFRRGVFTNEQLRQGYEKALSSGSTVKLIMPILGETGCRLAEIVGMKVEDLENDLIHIRPNEARRLKTSNSERTLPLVGYAKLALLKVLEMSDGEYLFPQYIKDQRCYATHASNALNKWLKKDFDGLTAHCLRHTLRDRLRAVECPSDMIDQIGGWRSVGGIGVRYGRGYGVEQMKGWIEEISLKSL
ncbi:tyrosine-type recombinase/integrase [Aestuariicoccus sp. MJ-SS9]|uniref:tyrosine-type recombinase/integrase n=1 Tax=Aestuariicoccus sp. MJ-SS9 TaxID=3079855 RepID=UPI00290EE62D|nr:tyrosine-type recombinase/integrase [Aestuariicoccus sp. MJ-SS9]MDU8911966.1 tyrosine-type recombinase/integrase [Aestuariicoccus sp. MJ-SS9]